MAICKWVDDNMDVVVADMSRYHRCWIDPESDEFLDPFGRQISTNQMLLMVYSVSGYDDSLIKKQYIELNFYYNEETGEYTKKALETGEFITDGAGNKIPVLGIRAELLTGNAVNDDVDLSGWIDFE